MRYLFGDSSESSLDINYLGFLRDAIDFGVAFLQADAGMSDARDLRGSRQLATAEQVDALEELGRTATAHIHAAAGDDPVLARTAAAIATAIDEVIKRDAGKVRGSLQGELDTLDADYQKMRDRCRTALGVLLAAHDLPGATETLSVRWNGALHEARLQQKVGFGVEALVALDIPASSLFAQDLKVERFADSAEIHAPEAAGWLKKEMKMVPHKIGRHLVTHVIVAPSGVTMKVRSTVDAGATGFDITVPRSGGPTIERVGKDGDATSFALDDRDLPSIRGMASKLESALESLRSNRGALVEATVDGNPLASLERPGRVVERLVQVIAPVVHEIVSHSLSPRELVIKRLVGNDRREEIFLSRAELVQKIEPLSAEQRRVFAPLGLFDEVAPPAAVPPPVAVESHPNTDAAEAAAAAADADEEPEVSVTIDAEAAEPPEVEEPPAPAPAPAPPVSAPAPAAAPSPLRTMPTLPTLPGTRPARRTMPPPSPPPPAPRADTAPEPMTNAQVAATIDAALRDLED